MKPTLVQYEAPGWGVGEVWLDDDGVVFYSELPRPKRTRPGSDAGGTSGAVPAAQSTTRIAGDSSNSAEAPLSPKRTQLASDAGDVLAGRLVAFFAGVPDDFLDVSLRLDDGFYGDCARVLRAVERGQVITYGELAERAGRPRAARAAGTFCARCQLAPFLPVHRVVAVGGIGSWGSHSVEYKRRMLELEGVTL
jgi:methylated-DNA-[protein]-cysteine S-methyltransferase